MIIILQIILLKSLSMNLKGVEIMEITLKQRMRLVKFCYKVGFLLKELPFSELKTEEERISRIHTLIRKGYRITEKDNKISEILNIKNGELIHEDIEDIQNIYQYLRR